MGANESQPVRNVDKRTARRDHAPRFMGAITGYRRGCVGVAPTPAHEPGERSRIRVCCRRRPIFAHELTAGEFDVLTCAPRADGQAAIVVHDCRMAADCRHLFVQLHED